MWKYKRKTIQSEKDVPKGSVAFVYKICDAQGRCYIGKKSMYSDRNIEVSKAVYDKLKSEGQPVTKTKNKAASKKGAVVWRYKKKVHSTSNWLTYTGSNTALNEYIKKGGVVEKEILVFCKTSHLATYYEVKYQMVEQVIETDNHYNDNILGKFYPNIFKSK